MQPGSFHLQSSPTSSVVDDDKAAANRPAAALSIRAASLQSLARHAKRFIAAVRNDRIAQELFRITAGSRADSNHNASSSAGRRDDPISAPRRARRAVTDQRDGVD
jgi:hypothetical protein